MPVALIAPVTSADVSVLYDPRPHRRSNYRHVYPGRSGRRYDARVRVTGVLTFAGSADTQLGAAALAAGWLRAEYGDDWPARRRADVDRAKRRAAGAG